MQASERAIDTASIDSLGRVSPRTGERAGVASERASLPTREQ